MRTDVIKFHSELTNDMAELQFGSICIKTLYHSRNTGRHKSRSSNEGHNELSTSVKCYLVICLKGTAVIVCDKLRKAGSEW